MAYSVSPRLGKCRRTDRSPSPMSDASCLSKIPNCPVVYLDDQKEYYAKPVSPPVCRKQQSKYQCEKRCECDPIVCRPKVYCTTVPGMVVKRCPIMVCKTCPEVTMKPCIGKIEQCCPPVACEPCYVQEPCQDPCPSFYPTSSDPCCYPPPPCSLPPCDPCKRDPCPVPRQQMCHPCCKPCMVMPVYRYEDGRIVRKLPVSAFKRNGMQDMEHSPMLGTINFISQDPKDVMPIDCHALSN